MKMILVDMERTDFCKSCQHSGSCEIKDIDEMVPSDVVDKVEHFKKCPIRATFSNYAYKMFEEWALTNFCGNWKKAE